MIAKRNRRRGVPVPGRAYAAIVLGLAGTLGAALVAFGANATASAPSPKLSSKYEYTVGDDIAWRMSGIFRIAAGIEEATLVYYDRESRHIIAEIVGGTDNVQGAEREIDGLVDVIQSRVVGYAKKRHSVDLTDRDVTLVYYVDTDESVPEEVVRRENGTFVVPKGEQEK